MAKASGGTRNYSNSPHTMNVRRTEYYKKLSSGEYDPARSYMDSSGGFVLFHNGHNDVKDHAKNKEDIAVQVLASKGYKVYLDDERGTISKVKMPDGRIYEISMDIKTINEANAHTIESNIRDGVRQIIKNEKAYGKPPAKRAVVLYQNTDAMDKNYVLSQIESYKKSLEEPKLRWMKDKLDYVIVVGKSGNVHRHYIKK